VSRCLGQDDTICAIATPTGVGSIGVIRVSGSRAFPVVQNIFKSSPKKKENMLCDFKSHTVHAGTIIDPHTGSWVDEALLVIMKGPRSYTGEDVAEIQSHGNPHLLQRILSLLTASGARLAEPGEFTRRAYLSGRIDLAQAEAVMDLIMAQSHCAQDLALHQLHGGLSDQINAVREGVLSLLSKIEASIDFTEQGIDVSPREEILEEIGRCEQWVQNLLAGYEEGRQIREGSVVVIAGRPNVGKSSVMNRLLGEDRAIVTAIAGTTRDTLSEWLSMSGHLIQIIDTAGFHETTNPIELEGMRRGEAVLKKADLVLFIADATEPFGDEDIRLYDRILCKRKMILLNKSDLSLRVDRKAVSARYPNDLVILCSAKTGDGFADLKVRLIDLLVPKSEGESERRPLVALLRQKNALDTALQGLQRARRAALENASVEFIAADLREAIDALGDIVGETPTDEILNQIFNRFCIGK
jgi:tRNA modification GTPase